MIPFLNTATDKWGNVLLEGGWTEAETYTDDDEEKENEERSKRVNEQRNMFL